jgi:CheY-like chemotaxis protein
VYGFVRQSGGTVRVHSTLGEGTTFELYLPALDEATQTRAQEVRSVPSTQRALRVLLTEDDASVAVITETMLKNLGHEVTRASSGPQAMQVLAGASFDLLISDVAMPGGMNGVELARSATALYPSLKVLLISGYAGELLDATLKEESWAFLKKPYLQDDLDQWLQTVLGETPAATRSAMQ